MGLWAFLVMLIEINDNLIDTGEIENISPVYINHDADGHRACFTIYMKTNYVKVWGELAEWGTDANEADITQKRKELFDIWKQGKETKKI